MKQQKLKKIIPEQEDAIHKKLYTDKTIQLKYR